MSDDNISDKIFDAIKFIYNNVVDMSNVRFLNFHEIGLKLKVPKSETELDVLAITNVAEFPRHIRFIENFVIEYVKAKYNVSLDIEKQQLNNHIKSAMEKIIPHEISELVKKLDQIVEEKFNHIFIDYSAAQPPTDDLEKVIFPQIKNFKIKGTLPVEICTKIIGDIIRYQFPKLKYVSSKFVLFYMSKTYNYVFDNLKQISKHLG